MRFRRAPGNLHHLRDGALEPVTAARKPSVPPIPFFYHRRDHLQRPHIPIIAPTKALASSNAEEGVEFKLHDGQVRLTRC